MQAIQALIITGFAAGWVTIFAILRFWLGQKGRRIQGTANNLSLLFTALAVICALISFSFTLRRAEREYKFKDGSDPTYVALFGVPVQYGEASFRLAYGVLITYILGIYFVKAAFLAMYFDMSTHMSNKLKIFLYSTIAYVFCTFVATMFLSTLWCRPIKRNWSLGPDFCNPMQYHTYVQIYTVLNATGDFLVMLVPTLILKTMQVRRGEKWAVAFLLFLGFLTIGATSARAAYLGRLAVATTADSTQDPGMLVSNIHICEIWSFFEVSAAVTALCLPSLRGYILKNRRAHANDVHQQIDTEGTTVPESPMQSASGASLTSKKEMAGEESGLKFWNSTESKQSYGRSSRGSDGGMARPADVRLPQYDRKVYH